MKNIPRKTAIELGLTHYFTGKPCKNNHISKRQVSDRACCQCKKDNTAKRREDPEFRKIERARESAAWKNNPERRARKKASDKKRRSSRRYKDEENRASREKYKKDKLYRKAKIAQASNYYRRHKPKIRERKNEWFKKKYKEDELFRVKHNLRSQLSRICKAAKMGQKIDTSSVGYTPDELKSHIERQFQKGMSWGNYGEWHIDHIIPVSYMVKSGAPPEKINCLSNLRPIWKEDNFKKRDKLESLL
ncbi:hypothetical protein [Zhongshania sp.]|uniref:hypothetical protein n=1 Tax=Zhongshania sp. TaxID=1971902 RepID=UPI0035682329